MKILLLNPPGYKNKAFIREGRCNQEQGVWATLWPPITLATAGAVLENAGHNVTILDCAALGIHKDVLLNRIRAGGFGLIVWSAATPSIESDLALANAIKEIQNPAKTAVLGTHVTALAEESLQQTAGLDFIIRNEPENTLADLAECLAKGLDINAIQGLSYQAENGQIVHCPSRPFIAEPDRLPYPAWHLLDLEKYKLPLSGEKFLMLAPVRGCPYGCTFCSARTYYGKQLRKITPARMVAEIMYNLRRFDIRQFFIWADTFTADRDYVERFCAEIHKSGLNIAPKRIIWTCNSRVDTVDLDLLSMMADAGCWMISYGIESGSQEILNQVQKKITLSQARKAVKMTNLAGMMATGHFVLGLPGETEETMQKTLQLALELELTIAQFYCAVPIPGAPLYNMARSRGWIDAKQDFVPFEQFRQDNAVMNLPGLTPVMVNAFRKKSFLRFYLRPRQLLKMLKLLKGANLINILKGGLKFIRWANS
jgi:radical SAM superfamily enzyme YgiQ (UPF0313 family)